LETSQEIKVNLLDDQSLNLGNKRENEEFHDPNYIDQGSARNKKRDRNILSSID
jgi:hypothetical protein